MNQQSFLLVPLALLGLLFSSCSKKVDHDSTLNRKGAEEGSAFSDPSRDLNAGEDLSPAGSALDGNLFASDDLLSPRDPGLDAFSDPLNVIRPFDPVYFGFDQYNICLLYTSDAADE